MAPRKRKQPVTPAALRDIGGMAVAGLTADQIRVLTDIQAAVEANERFFALWYGGIRAGKSTGGAYGIALHSKAREGCEYIVGAYTIRQAMAIFLPKFKAAAALLDMKYKEYKGAANPHIELGENLISLYGGSDAGRDRNVQGLTVAGLLLDEIPLLNKEFIHQNEARASEAGALRIYTANKVHPYHWTTQYYFDRAKKGLINAKLYDSATADNPYIGQDFIDERINEYDDKHRTRFIENEFSLDSPPLYSPTFADAPEGEFISVLYGEGTTFHVLNAARTDYGYCVTGATEYDANLEIADVVFGSTVLINADRPMLARMLRRGGMAVRGYQGEYAPRRLEQTQRALSGAVLRFAPDLDSLTQAVDEYSTGGIYKSPLIRCLEALGEYVSKKGNRQ